jgi:hypothetical protein
MYPEWLLGIHRNPTLPRPPDSENQTPVDSVKESQSPYAPDAVRAEGQPGSGVTPVVGGDSAELVKEVVESAPVAGGDLRVPNRMVRFPDASP